MTDTSHTLTWHSEGCHFHGHLRCTGSISIESPAVLISQIKCYLGHNKSMSHELQNNILYRLYLFLALFLNTRWCRQKRERSHICITEHQNLVKKKTYLFFVKLGLGLPRTGFSSYYLSILFFLLVPLVPMQLPDEANIFYYYISSESLFATLSIQ